MAHKNSPCNDLTTYERDINCSTATALQQIQTNAPQKRVWVLVCRRDLHLQLCSKMLLQNKVDPFPHSNMQESWWMVLQERVASIMHVFFLG